MTRLQAAMLAAMVVVTACSSSGTRVDAPSASATSSTTTSTSPLPARTAVVEMQPDDVVAALRTVSGADPVLEPTAVPSNWTATVSVAPSAFAVTYTGPDGERFELSISVPNPPPPTPTGSQQLGFRGDPQGLYQQQSDDPRTDRFLVWKEPGQWSGDPAFLGSARPNDVPYFASGRGVTEAVFLQLAGSLAPVPHAAPPAHPSVVAIPSQPLHDGQSVEVILSGFGPYDRVRLSECATKDSATSLGCGPQLAAQPFVDTDASGAGTITFVVHDTAPAKPLDTTATFDCADRCVLVATTNLPATTPAIAALAFG